MHVKHWWLLQHLNMKVAKYFTKCNKKVEMNCYLYSLGTHVRDVLHEICSI